MSFIKKLIFFMLICICTIRVYEIGSNASFLDELKYINEIDINTDFSILVSDTYTQNNCIVQAAANANGDFATMSYYFPHSQFANNGDKFFQKKFVDIFDNQGNFICELIFETKLDPTLRMAENYVYIIFYETVLIFDIDIREAKYCSYEIVSMEEVYEELFYKKNKFEVGEWKYKLAKQQSIGYRQLIRYNETEKQVLVDIPLEIDNGLIIMLIVISFIVTIEVVKLIRKRKAKINYQE